ncbi:MAG: hypothetical protein HYT86_06790, partial [candidate division NC10 bacterium]|nr:hypothetical protein [candidate division NC10 bacterium]
MAPGTGQACGGREESLAGGGSVLYRSALALLDEAAVALRLDPALHERL